MLSSFYSYTQPPQTPMSAANLPYSFKSVVYSEQCACLYAQFKHERAEERSLHIELGSEKSSFHKFAVIFIRMLSLVQPDSDCKGLTRAYRLLPQSFRMRARQHWQQQQPDISRRQNRPKTVTTSTGEERVTMSSISKGLRYCFWSFGLVDSDCGMIHTLCKFCFFFPPGGRSMRPVCWPLAPSKPSLQKT